MVAYARELSSGSWRGECVHVDDDPGCDTASDPMPDQAAAQHWAAKHRPCPSPKGSSAATPAATEGQPAGDPATAPPTDGSPAGTTTEPPVEPYSHPEPEPHPDPAAPATSTPPLAARPPASEPLTDIERSRLLAMVELAYLGYWRVQTEVDAWIALRRDLVLAAYEAGHSLEDITQAAGGVSRQSVEGVLRRARRKRDGDEEGSDG